MARRDPTAPAMDRSMRKQAAMAKAMALLPAEVQVRLSGGSPVVIDGQTLDPALQLALAMIERRGGIPMPGSAPLDVEREFSRKMLVAQSGVVDAVGAVRNIHVDGAEGQLKARFYSTPELGGPHPLLVFFHGGGFVYGDVDSAESFCRTLCRHGGVDVLSVEYRLAPEHHFPAAVDDARAAFDWAVANAADLGSDPTRVAVGGDSAGGNLAAVTALDASRSLAPPPVAQLLMYPVTDWAATIAESQKTESYRLFGEGFGLSPAMMDWYCNAYCESARSLGGDPRMSPLRADDLSGLPPAIVVTAGFDPLRDEGEAYAARLADSGVEVVHRRFESLIHGFVQMGGLTNAAREAMLEVAGSLRALVRR